MQKERLVTTFVAIICLPFLLHLGAAPPETICTLNPVFPPALQWLFFFQEQNLAQKQNSVLTLGLEGP